MISDEKLKPEVDIIEDISSEGSSQGEVNVQVHSQARSKRWWKTPHLLNLNFQIFVITLTSTTIGYDSSMLNGLQSLPEWQEKMGHPQGAILGALTSSLVLGGVVASLYVPYMADYFGRKPTLAFAQSLVVIGAVLQGLSNSYGFFMAARIIIGLGKGASCVCPTLISELAYPTHREVATTFYNVCWYLGAVFASWVTYGTRNMAGDHSWRVPSYLQGLFPIIQLALILWVPESPRYYVARNKPEKAREMLNKFHIGNSQDTIDQAFVDFELAEFEAQIKDAAANTKSSSYSDFIMDPQMRKRTWNVLVLSTITQFSGNGLVSYYLTKVLISIGITEKTKQLQINGCLMIYNLVISASVASSVNRFKRKKMFITCVASMLTCYVIWTILSAFNIKQNFENKSLGRGVLAMIFLYYLAYDIGCNGLPFTYVTEIMPYSHRSKGLNFFLFTQMLILIFNGFVNPIAMDAIGWKYYIVFCCVNATMLVLIILLFVETSGYTLEEIDQVFDPAALNKYHSRKHLAPEESA